MATIKLCSPGYAPLIFSTGSVIKGCISCGGFGVNINTNADATGYISCKLPTNIVDNAALTTLGVAGF